MSGGMSHGSAFRTSKNPEAMKKPPSESDSGNIKMGGYDPNLGVGNKQMGKMMNQGYPKAGSKKVLGNPKKGYA